MQILCSRGTAAHAAVVLLAAAAACGLETELEGPSPFERDDVATFVDALSLDTARYEAEDRTSENGAREASNHPGFTGTGFMDFGGNGTWIEWNRIQVPSPGVYQLRFRYANGSVRPRSAQVRVNDILWFTVSFEPTGGWDRWGTEVVLAEMPGGDNTVRVEAITDAGGPNLDHVEVTPIVPDDPCDDVLYEAEDRSAEQGCQARLNHAGFTGRGFMDFGGNGTWIEWHNIRVESPGVYQLQFRYANGSAGPRRSQVRLNDIMWFTVPFEPTGAWDRWSTETVLAEMRSGDNTVRVEAVTGAGGPNLDHVVVVPDPVEPPPACR